MKQKPITAALALVALLVALVWILSRPDESPESAPAAATANDGAPAARSESSNLDAASKPIEREAVLDAPKAGEARTSTTVGLAHVRGRVTRDGVAFPDVAVRMFGGGAGVAQQSSSTGAFAFEVAAGSWQIGCAPGAGTAPICYELQLAAGETRDVAFGFAENAELCVRVWQRVGDLVVALEGANVAAAIGVDTTLAHVDWPRELGLAGVFTDFEGRASVSHSPLTSNLLFVSKPGYAPAVVKADFHVYLSYTPLSADGCFDVFLDRLGPPVRGIVLDAERKPVAGAIVFASAPLVIERGPLSDYGRVESSELPEPMPVPVGSLHPPFARTNSAGLFTLDSPDPDAGERASYSIVVIPGRADLVHHNAHSLDVGDLGRALEIEIVLPSAWPVEIEFVDARGVALDGMASLRDRDGRAYAPTDAFRSHDLQEQSAGRFFSTSSGKFRLLHPGGPAVVGLSPDNTWDAREVEIEIDPGTPSAIRIVMP